MKKIILMLFALQTISCFGQKWTDLIVDDNLTISIPENYQITDTLGQRIIMVQVDNGLIQISRLPNKGNIATKIPNETVLNEFYQGLQKGIVNSSKGELLSSESPVLNKLKLIKFSYRVKIGNELQIHDCLGLFLNDNTYLIQFWHLETMTDELKKVRDKVFSSLKTSSTFTLKNQLTDSKENSASFNKGYILGKFLGPIIIIGIFVYFIFWLNKRKKKAIHINEQQVSL
jgi:hypothetical protein